MNIYYITSILETIELRIINFKNSHNQQITNETIPEFEFTD